MPADLVDSWDDVPTVLQPVAPMTGPFPTAPFLEAWRSCHAPSDTQTPIAVSATGTLPLWIDQGVIRLSGEADLTDYHSPLGPSVDESVALISQRFSGRVFSFDSLPCQALEPLASALAAAGVASTSRHDGATLVVELPADTESWLASLSKKHRHELRRKRRRFVDALGEPVLERRTDPEAFEAFVTMHRSSSTDKGDFMTEGMERFFWSLITDAEASVDLLTASGSPVAAAFVFADARVSYLYNSAYAADAADASPGIVLIASMIERAVDEGLQRFDFLKGDESYKYRLGAVDRPLTILEGEFP
ncbi:MAG: GNAT family N-acetyltransferase [Actinomycetota bacterium]|nr:GNAT family N-acetyltransferase [Actinomycetota bacterium]